MLDFLIAEVFPVFEQTALRKKPSSCNNAAAADAEGGSISSTIARRMSLFRSPDKNSLTIMTTKILEDPLYLAAFKSYMIRKGAENLLFAYNEVIELKERMSHILQKSKSPRDHSMDTMPQQPQHSNKYAVDDQTAPNANGAGLCSPRFSAESTASLQTFFFYINILYDTYLSLGSTFRLKVPAHALEAFQKKICICKSVDLTVLEPIEVATFEALIRDHLDGFLDTAEYRKLVRAGRGSILVIAQDLKQPLSPDPLRRSSIETAMKAKMIKESTNSYFGGTADDIPGQ